MHLVYKLEGETTSKKGYSVPGTRAGMQSPAVLLGHFLPHE
jgi:hypothetical protein